jgi:hypothetical protein
MKDQNYSDLVAQAEKAVASVKDPDLKRIAFQKILDDLLGASGAKNTPQTLKTRTRRATSNSKSKSSSRGGPKAYIGELIGEDFFKKPKTISQVKAELENRGHHIPLTSLSGPLQRLCQGRTLRRQKLKASGNKQTYAYSAW